MTRSQWILSLLGLPLLLALSACAGGGGYYYASGPPTPPPPRASPVTRLVPGMSGSTAIGIGAAIGTTTGSRAAGSGRHGLVQLG